MLFNKSIGMVLLTSLSLSVLVSGCSGITQTISNSATSNAVPNNTVVSNSTSSKPEHKAKPLVATAKTATPPKSSSSTPRTSTQSNPTTVPTDTTLKVYDSVIANGHYVNGTDLKAQGSTMVYSSYKNYMKNLLTRQYGTAPVGNRAIEDPVLPYIGINKKVYYIVNVTVKNFSNARQKFVFASSEFLFNNLKFKSTNALHQYFNSVGGSNTDWNKVFMYLKH